MKKILFTFFCLLLTACDDGNHFAPVTDISGTEPIPKTGLHRVVRGESLYAIAWRYGLDYRELALRNHIEAPYTIHTNQVIYLRDHRPAVLTKTAASATYVAPQQNSPEPNYAISQWSWPAQGKMVNGFSPSNKGINIAGKYGNPIYAAGAGQVVYAGDGLRGYGNLIIIKHNSLYLSAYAHNSRIFVKEGDWVRQRQKIAEMGNTDTDKTMLHFEIRRAGKPMDPMELLQSQ